MPVLNINEHEAALIIKALETEGSRVIKEQICLEFPADNRFPRNYDQQMIDLKSELNAVTDLRLRVIDADDCVSEAEAKRRTAVANMIIAECEAVERVNGGKAPTEDTPEPRGVWHHNHGWLTKSFFESDRGKAAYEAALQAVKDNVTGPGLTPDEARDQIAPGSWITLPDGYEVDADPYEVTDPDEKIVIAAADTQTDGTVVGFYAYPTEADKSVNNAIWALITRNFGLVSERDIQLAEKVMRSDPNVLARIRSSVEDLQKAYGDDGKFLVNIQVDGRTAEVKVDEKLLKVLNDLHRRFLTTAAVS